MAGDFKIRVGIDFDDSELGKIRSLIEKPVDININTAKAKSQLNDIANSIKGLGKSGKTNVDIGFKADKASAKKVVNDSTTTLKTKINTSLAEVDKLELKLKNLGSSGSKALNQSVKGLRDLNTGMDSLKADNVQQATQEYKKFAEQVKLVASEVDKAQSKFKLSSFDERLNIKRQKYKNAMDMFAENNPKMRGSIFEKQYMKIRVDLDTAQSEKELDNLMAKARLVQQSAKINGKTGDTLFSGLSKTAKSMMSFVSVGSVLYGVADSFRMMYQNVLDVDTAMTELKRVTDLSVSQYADLYGNLTVSAKQYGVQLTDLISATADWSRAGFEADVASGLAEVTSVYQHIADLDYDEASENLLTAYKGFESQLTSEFQGNAVEAVGYVADVFNELDNNYAVTAAGVGAAIKRSASALQVAGNTFQESAAMVTGISEVTQDPEKAGNALKVVSMRLRGMKGDLEELGEDVDENVTNLSKMQGQILNLTHGKVNIFDNNGEFKSTYDILRGVADVWEELSSVEQSDLLETMAGKHRGNDIAAIFGNWEHVEDALISATNAEGSAMREQEKYAQSLQGRLNSLMASFQSLSNTVIDSDILKGLVSGAEKAVEVIDFLIDKIGILPTLAIGIGAGASMFGKGLFKTVIDESGKASIKISNDFKIAGNNITDIFSGIGQIVGEVFNSINSKFGGGKVFKFDSMSMDGAFGGLSFINRLDDDINKLKAFRREVQSFGDGVDVNIDNIIGKTMTGASSKAKELARTWDLSDESLANFTQTALASNGVISSTSSSLSNARNILSSYNGIVDRSGIAQAKFANAISTINPFMGKYLSGLGGAKASLVGYGVQLAATTVATNVLKVATMALNAALTMGIGLAVQFVIEGIMHFINAEQELSDKVSEVTAEYDNQKKTLSDAKSTIDDVADSYERLSKGVNVKTNENIDLSTEEYEEYLNIVNQIADTFPELVTGYDEQGNAILSCAGSVDKLTEAYENLEKKANNEILDNAEDIAKDSKNKSNDIFSDKWKQGKTVDANFRAYNKLKELTESKSLKDSINDMNADDLVILTDVLQNYGEEWKSGEESRQQFIKRVVTENKETVNKVLTDTQSAMQTAASGMQDIAEATIGNALIDGDYGNISDEMRQYIKGMVPNMDYEFFDSLGWDANKLKEYINDTLSTINSLDENSQKKIELMFDMQSKLNSDDCTIGEYIDSVNDVENILKGSGLSEDAQKQLKISLGLDDNQIIKDANAAKEKLKKQGVGEEIREELVDSLTSSELEAVMSLNIDMSNMSVDEIRKEIYKAADEISAMSFTVDIDFMAENLDKLNNALGESLSGTGLGTESIEHVQSMFKELQGYNQSALFERTANGIRMNTDEFRRLSSELANENTSGLAKKMDILGDKYIDARAELAELTYGTEEYNAKAKEIDGLEKQINETEMLSSQLEGLTSSFNQWQMVESAGSQRDMYETVLNGFKTVEDELSRGWVDDGTIEFIELLSGKELTSGNIDDIRAAWDGLGQTIKDTTYSVKDFFTVNEDGQSTSDGVYNFLDAVGQLEEEKFGGTDVVKRDDGGNIIGFDFQIVGGDKAIADALGISEELVQIMVRAADDAGFVVSMDGTLQQFDIVKAKAQEAAASLNETFGRLGKEGFDFNFNAKKVEEIQPQLEKAQEIWNEFKNNKDADGKIDMSVEGAEEAFTVVSTLQTMLDKASEPTYMNIQASQVEKELQKPLGELQEYERLTQTEHQLNIKGADTTKLKESKEEILDYFDELQESNPELAAQLKIEDLSREELQKKLENGELEIPATVDLQLEMNDNLAILADKALLDAGVIDEEEFQKRVDVRLDANVDGSDVNEKVDKAIADAGIDGEQKDVSVKFLTDTSDVDSYTPEQLESIVTYVKDITDIDSYTPTDKKAVCDFIVNNQDVMAYTPEEKVAIAKYMADPQPLEAYEPEDRDAIVRFQAEHGAVDAWNPNDRTAIATFLLNNALVEGYQPSDKDMAVIAEVDKSNVDTYQPPSKTMTIWATIKKTASDLWGLVTGGGGKANGTAHVNGTAFADGSNHKKFKSGNWGTEDSGTALMGELGQETIVRDGHFFTVGDNGAEFVKYRKGDIIFNHRQTEELFKNGYVTSGGGRGKAYVDGTAFARGSSGSGGWGRPGTGSYNYNVSSGNSKSTKSSKSSKSSDSKSSEEAKKFEEVLDWIAIAIDRIEREIKNLDTVASSTFRGWSERTSALNKQIAQTRNEIDLQQRAYDRYMKAANDVGLDAGWAQKVRDGKVDVELITDENVADKVKQYQEWYEKALDARDAVIELTEAESQLFQQRFDNVSEKFDGYLGVIEHEKNMLDEFISQSEAKGYITSQKYYEALSKNTNDRIAELKKQRDEMTAEMNAAVDSGAIEKYSQSWYEMVNAIDDVTLEIESANTELLEFKKTMRELDWEVFELIQDRISGITEESDFLIDLMSNKKLYDDKGQLTDEGQASMGLHGVNYNTYMNQADQYAKKVAELNAQIAKDPYNQDLINKRDEYLEAQRESILNAEDEKNAIRDMVEEGINLELDALQELIDKRNEALDNAKD